MYNEITHVKSTKQNKGIKKIKIKTGDNKVKMRRKPLLFVVLLLTHSLADAVLPG